MEVEDRWDGYAIIRDRENEGKGRTFQEGKRELWHARLKQTTRNKWQTIPFVGTNELEKQKRIHKSRPTRSSLRAGGKNRRLLKVEQWPRAYGAINHITHRMQQFVSTRRKPVVNHYVLRCGREEGGGEVVRFKGWWGDGRPLRRGMRRTCRFRIPSLRSGRRERVERVYGFFSGGTWGRRRGALCSKFPFVWSSKLAVRFSCCW